MTCLIHFIYQHLVSHSNFTSIVFVDFSSTFNTPPENKESSPSQNPSTNHPLDSQSVRIGTKFHIITKNCNSPLPIRKYFKYSNDTAIFGLTVPAYQHPISHFTQWCTDNYFHLNIGKTKLAEESLLLPTYCRSTHPALLFSTLPAEHGQSKIIPTIHTSHFCH